MSGWNPWGSHSSSWQYPSDSWGGDGRPQEAEAFAAGRIVKKVWDMCEKLGGTAKTSMPLDDRLRLIQHMVPALRKMKLMTLSSEQADAVIFIASGQQPELRVKVIADTMETLMDMFREEYGLRRDNDAAGLLEMIENHPSNLVTYAKKMLFVPFEAASGPTSQYYAYMHSTHLFAGWQACCYI